MDIKKLVEKAEERDLSDVAALEDYFEALRLLEKTDDVLAHGKGKTVTKLCSKYAREKLDMRFLDLQERSLLFCAPYDFDSYCRYLEWDREPGKRFYMPRRKQLLPLVNAMQDLEDDKLDLLAISLPPGVGKSTLSLFYLTALEFLQQKSDISLLIHIPPFYIPGTGLVVQHRKALKTLLEHPVSLLNCPQVSPLLPTPSQTLSALLELRKILNYQD